MRRALLGFVAAASLAGAASAADSPACALLAQEEAEAALGKPVVVKGGDVKNGQSDCGWTRGGGGVIAVTHWSPEVFAGGKPTAAERFSARVGKLGGKGRVGEPDGIAEKARILDESAPGVAAYTIVLLQNGAVAELSARGITRADALAAARAVAGRMLPEAAPADLRPTGEPPPDAAPEPPSETPPSPPTEPQPPAPEPTPDVAPRPAAPEPPAPAPRPAKTGSPACKLVTKADLAALTEAEFAMADGGPAAGGESSCSWRARTVQVFVAVNLLDREAIPSTSDSAEAYFAEMAQQVSGSGAQLVAGVGQRAILETTGEGDDAERSISILANGRIVFLNTSRVSEDKAIALARAVAARM